MKSAKHKCSANYGIFLKQTAINIHEMLRFAHMFQSQC